MVRVLIVDDHGPFLQVAHELVAATPGFEDAGDARSGEEGIDAVRRAAPDLVLADVHMSGMDGVEMTRRITESEEAPVVVLITAHDVEDIPEAARTCGAAAIVAKQDLGPSRLSELWRVHGKERRVRDA
jgi:DNA-binding NarL/FixJ family response regulator